ncbi:MAG: type VI secretion system baseplate subunit TssK [Pseudomonadota bacterium]
MSGANRVLWSEGMFLRTQHFQQQDRHTDALVRDAIRTQAAPAYGFRELDIDETALTSGLMALTGASGVFPDGTSFTIPDGSMPVEAIPVGKAVEPGLVSLALAAEAATGPTIEASHADPAGARLRGEMLEIRDAADPTAAAETIEIAKLAPRILLPGQDTAGYVTLPLARFAGLSRDGAVELDPLFLPPALTTEALPWYGRLAQEVSAGLAGIGDAHASVVLGGTGASVENLLILELANEAGPRMTHIAELNTQHPEAFFCELAGLAGRMSTYGSSARRMAELPAYDHNDPQPAFQAVADTLRSLILSLRHVEERARTLPVARHSENVWTVRIDNPEIIRSSRIVLRIGGEMSEQLMRKLFVDQATVGAADQFDNLWTSRLTGIPLKPLHSQPREIPYDGDRLCLELDRNSQHWSELDGAPGFVVGVSGKLEREPEIDCYAIKR